MKHFTKLFMLISFIGMMGLNATAKTQNDGMGGILILKEHGVGSKKYSIAATINSNANNIDYINVQIELVDDNSPTPSAKTFTLLPIKKNENRFENTDLTFKSSALGFEYLVTATMYDTKGNKVGVPETFWVTVFEKGEEKEKDPCSGKLTIDKMSISPSRDEKGNLKVLFSFPIKAKKGDPSAAFYNYIKWDYCNSNATDNATGYVKTISLSPKYNEKTSTFEATYTFPTADKTGSWTMNDIQFGVTNPCGDAFYYEAGALLLTGGPIEKPDLDVDVEVKMNHPDSCGKPDVDSLYWEVGTVEKTKNTTPVTIHFPKNYVLGGNIVMSSGSTITAGTKATDGKGNTETQNGTMKLNEKTGWYEVTVYYSKLENSSFELTNLNVIVYNTCGDSNGFVGHINQAKNGTGPGTHICICKPGFKRESNQTNNDSCNSNYKLKEVNFNTSTSGGIYTMSFSFNFEKNSDIPNSLTMVVQLTDCNGKTTDIKIKLSYNASSGQYTGSQAIQQNKECTLSLTSGTITAYDPCNNSMGWDIDFESLQKGGCPCMALAIKQR